MKKLFVSLVATLFITTSSFAQLQTKGFAEVNGTYSFDKTFAIFDQFVFGANLGYNYEVQENLFVGLTAGISKVNADYDDLDKFLWTFTPKATYKIEVGDCFYWTPSFYVGLGFGKTDLNLVDQIFHYNIDGSISYTNLKIGLNILSFDFSFEEYKGYVRNLALNFNVFTPYYNIMMAKYSNEDVMKHLFEETFETKASYNGFVWIGAQIGLKYYL